MSESLSRIEKPELFVGIAGPIGVDIDAISISLNDALIGVGYRPVPIRLTEEMTLIPTDIPIQPDDFYAEAISKMRYGNAVRNKTRDPAALARLAVQAIRERRKLISGNADLAADGVAYVIRQLKRPEEVEFLRRLYGRQFVMISAYGPLDQRRALIQERLRQSMATTTRLEQLAAFAEQLIDTDASERDKAFGQQLRDTFHRGDVFIDGLSRPAMEDKLTRFVHAFFGRTEIGPSRDEFGMYAAASAALRSTDLSRQVGAAIFTGEGELISQGCNEVPKASGGAYWDTEQPDFRDVRVGEDPNAREIGDVLRDLFQRLNENGYLSDKALALGAPSSMVRALTGKDGPLADAAILDLTEYGRVVHAEMHAICDAARLGRSVKGGILYCTTFPCHNCTKHILAAGIARVVYIEPYPKSLAKRLHANEIEVEGDSASRLVFKPFLGIAPARYRDIFQKGRRKDADGRARRWYDPSDKARPMVDVLYPSYLAMEDFALQPLLGHITARTLEQEEKSS
jgi:deoxycytidylate deaminase